MIATEQAAIKEDDFPKDLPAMLIRGEVTLAGVFGLDRDSLYEIAQLGYGLLNSGNLREAKQLYAGLVAADPYDSVFHCHLAAVHHRLGELDEALQQYTEALNFNFANVDAMVGRSEIQLSRGELATGISGLKQAIEIDSDGTRPSTLRARALLMALRRAVDDSQ
jgi:tetratricopeptide (TPR) repeat protein